jgi:hypothetical protein
VVFTTATKWGFLPALITSLVLGTVTAVKEFWYDATQEVPKQSFSDNMLDFGMYVAGIGTAWLVHLV